MISQHQDQLRPRARTVAPSGHWECLRLPEARAYHLDMSRLRPEWHDSDPPDRSSDADVLLRQEPDEEEDEGEDEDDGKKVDDDDENDGYSE